MNEFHLEAHESLVPELAQALNEGLTAYNRSKVGAAEKKVLMVAAKDASGKILGGISGHTHRGWLHISQLWVSEEARNTGLGTELMQLAESEAKARGCHAAHLDTFSFQALGFYQKQGFQAFGELEDFPLGHKRIFLQKRF